MNGARVHSLGTVLAALAATAAIGSALIGARREKAAARRLREALGARYRRRPRWRPPAGSYARLRGWGPPVAAGLGAATLIGGVPSPRCTTHTCAAAVEHSAATR